MAFVLDASVAIAWFVKGQATGYPSALLRRAAHEPLHIPPLWHAEFANALPIAVRDGPLIKAAGRAGVAAA